MMNGRRILFILNIDWFFISHRLPIALELIKQGYEVHIAAIITNKRSELEDLGIIVHPLVMRRGNVSPIELISNFFQMYSIIQKVRPDILHLITIKPNIFGGIAARILRVPRTVAAISGLGTVFVARGFVASVRRFFVKILYRLALKQRDLKVIFQNSNDKEILQALIGLQESNIEMIYGSGVDLERFQAKNLEKSAPIVMFAARLIHEKGVLEFIEAARYFSSLERDLMNAPKFVLVGMPDYDNPSSVTSAEIKKWEAEGIIEYWGHQTDMPDILSKIHIFVYPSYYGEGLAKMLLEVAACGRVIVTTDHPGCREAIVDGTTGVLVPPRDPLAVINALSQLLKDPHLVASMGRAGRRLAEQNFDVSFVVARHLNIYTELLKRD